MSSTSIQIDEYPYPVTQNVANFVSLKLSSTNFLLWKTQMLNILESYDLQGFITGETKPPPQFVVVEESGAQSNKLNPNFIKWRKTDRLVKGWLTATLSEEVFGIVVGLDTAIEVWNALVHAFAHVSSDRTLALKQRLTSMNRGIDTLAEYLRRFKAVCDDLAAIGKPVPNHKKSWWLLNGLGKGYEMFTTTMLRPPIPPYSKIVTLLESHSERHQLDTQTQAAPQMAFYNQHSNKNKKHNGSSNSFNSKGRALKCFNRFNHSFTLEIIPQELAAFTIADNQDSEWFPDTGATDHITGNPTNIESGNKSLQLNDVLLVPDIKKDLISDKSTNRVVARGTKKDGLYALVGESKDGSYAKAFFSSRFRRVDNECWHQRLGHPHQRVVDHLRIKNFISLDLQNKFSTICCKCFPYLGDYRSNKLEPKSLPCVFIGYSTKHKGYKCFYPPTGRIYISRHVVFDEKILPFSTPAQLYDTNPIEGELSTFSDWEESSLPKQMTNVFPISSFAPPTTNHMDCQQDSIALPTLTEPETPSPLRETQLSAPPIQPLQNSPHHIEMPSQSTLSDLVQTHSHTTSNTSFVPPYIEQSNPPPAPFVPIPNHHPMVTRSKQAENTSFVPPFIEQSNPPPEPFVPTPNHHPMVTRSKQGIQRPNPKYLDLNTKRVTHDIPTEPRSITSAKRHIGWVAAMDEELAALHANHTWSLVPHQPNMNVIGIRLVLTIAVVKGWDIRQIDVKNAFLHSSLSTPVYMHQPPGYIDPKHPTHVYQLNRALYGLKQVSRAWFDQLSTFLLSLGFHSSISDPSLFIFHSRHGILILLLYVDDMVITGNDPTRIKWLITQLGQEFSIKDLGFIHHFLGIEAHYTNNGLFLCQTRYAEDILHRASMQSTRPISTPMLEKGRHLPFTDGPYPNPSHYRSLVGALQYLTFTRPDLSYSVNFACQFMHSPTMAHYKLVKRILRYVRGTTSLGIIIHASSTLDLYGFSDADWAGCPTTRRSTTGFCTFLGSNCISWSAKKQPTVAHSSAEAEYRAMASTAAELTWLSFLLRDLGALIGPIIESEFTLIANVKEEIQKIDSNLRTIQAVLNDAGKRRVKEEAVKLWLDKLKEVCSEMKKLLNEWAMIRAQPQQQEEAESSTATWTCNVAREILESLAGQSPNMTTLQSLLNEICYQIQGRKFFIVFDDVWTEDSTMWDPVRIALKHGANVRRILVTTCKQTVAEMMRRAHMINLPSRQS
uniref:Reverse transcriptase Ty1/copia-type domain-containing protein n=1 Tax=Fagus sylvatica TaxID=28930 RepID=A0A2N9F121_FAGSY